MKTLLSSSLSFVCTLALHWPQLPLLWREQYRESLVWTIKVRLKVLMLDCSEFKWCADTLPRRKASLGACRGGASRDKGSNSPWGREQDWGYGAGWRLANSYLLVKHRCQGNVWVMLMLKIWSQPPSAARWGPRLCIHTSFMVDFTCYINYITYHLYEVILFYKNTANVVISKY